MLGIKKTLLCVGGLMLAAGGPVTMFSASDFATGVKQNWFAGSTATSAANRQQPDAASPSADSANEATPASTTSSSQNALPTPSLAEVLRFDVTVEWVMRRWPRVSTGLPYLQLQGYRVPLVTGARLTDLAGSLTYYFNARQEVQRITFHGTTGDPRVLVGLLSGRHRFARRLTNDPGAILYEAVDAGNKPVGTLKIRSAQVIRADQPFSRFEVDLAMDRG